MTHPLDDEDLVVCGPLVDGGPWSVVHKPTLVIGFGDDEEEAKDDLLAQLEILGSG